MMKLKGDIDPHIAIDLCNRASLAFLQRHLGKILTEMVDLTYTLCLQITW